VKEIIRAVKEGWQVLLLSIGIGLAGYAVKEITKSAIIEPLLVAMVLGIACRALMKDSENLKPGLTLSIRLFMPFGIAFYALKNLNFAKIAEVKPGVIILLMAIVAVYVITIFLLGRFLKQKKEITYLTATGSAICGASAIAITAPVIEAEPDDVSISLLSVALAAFVGLFIILPFLAALFNMDNKVYALLTGGVLQFTGFVNFANANTLMLPAVMLQGEAVALGGFFKTTRYLGLLVILPFLASLKKRKAVIPLALWLFLGAGILGTYIYKTDMAFYKNTLMPFVIPIYNIIWCIAMAAIGLNADIKGFFSNNAIKALVMAFAGFAAAIAVFFLGFSFIKSF
jgi:uncharacterized integral membrane protein (TIGR00698 family)